MFLSSDRGKRLLNFTYSWGASIVILGAMFKILHLPYANQILFIAMIVESCVFFISGFDHPFSEYHWEEVFPVLKSSNPLDRPDFSGGSGGIIGGGINLGGEGSANNISGGGGVNVSGSSGGGGGGTVIIGGGGGGDGSGVIGNGVIGGVVGGGVVGGGVIVSGGRAAKPADTATAVENAMGSLGLNISEEDTKNLTESIQKLNDAAEQISKMAELTEVTQKYLDQLSGISDSMAKFTEVTTSLTNVSDTLLNSYKSITDNSDGINQNSRGYVQQMELLNRNISGLNTIYEIQLKSISSQIESIEHINGGLNRIKEMYDGSVVDSSVFRNETEKMAQQLAQLNTVYGRLLQAMTVNMGYQQAAQQSVQQQQAAFQAQQQTAYQQPQNYQQPYGYQQPNQPQNPFNNK